MKIGVVGLGLIGGSIFKALRERYDVIGISSTVNEANVSNDYTTLKVCDVVFVCTPMNATLEVLERLDNILSPDTIVTDVCSIKEFVSQKKYKFKFIPSHPMAGTENKGWQASYPELFKGAKWAITPISGVVLEEQEILEDIIKYLGAEPIITTPEEHDKAVALISHFPLLVAQALCLSIKDNKLAQILAASGFRDTTRLALSNTEMANDMILYNRDNVEIALKSFEDSVDKLLQSDYLNKVIDVKKFRENLYS